MKLKKFLKKHGYQIIYLTTLPSGHHLLGAKLNGKNGNFILDTGASTTCIDENKIEKFKIKAKDTEHKATGAGSNDIDILFSKKNKLKIGNWQIKKIPLVVMNLEHINEVLNIFDIEIDGIIGADVLHKGKGIIQYEKELLFLK